MRRRILDDSATRGLVAQNSTSTPAHRVASTRLRCGLTEMHQAARCAADPWYQLRKSIT